MFLLCIENVKAFTAPFSSHNLINENTFMFLATGVHSISNRWKKTDSSSNSSIDNHQLSQTHTKSSSVSHPVQNSRPRSLTSLKMAFGIGTPNAPTSAPAMLDMKTSINAFGSWYNSMDPVARPPIYDE